MINIKLNLNAIKQLCRVYKYYMTIFITYAFYILTDVVKRVSKVLFVN